MKFYILIALFIVSLFSSAQNSITWNMGMNISANTYGNMHPRITFDGKGNPLVIWGRMSDEGLFFSRWNGTAFTSPVKLNPSWLTVATASWMGPDIASKGDTVYIVMKRTPEASDTSHIYIIRSFNGGVSFSSPVRVDFIADSISRFPTVSIDATGNPVVAFMKFNSSFMKSRWVVTKSTDYGNTFSTDVKASGYSGSSAEVCDCCPGALVSSKNVSTMLYRDNLSNIRDIWTGVSTNNNGAFYGGFKVDNNNWMITSCPSSGPDGVIIADSLYTVFMSSGSGSYRTYLSRSSITLGFMNSTSKLTGNITGLSQQNYPRIASDGKAAAIVWKQTISGTSQLPILFTNDLTKGLPTVYDTVDLNDITNADVAMSNGKLFVVWEDDNSGTIKYRSGSYTPSTNGISSLLKEKPDFKCSPNPIKNVLNITVPENKKYLLNIFNSLGEIIYTIDITSDVTVQTSNFPTGIYFVQIRSGNTIRTEKVIKQ